MEYYLIINKYVFFIYFNDLKFGKIFFSKENICQIVDGVICVIVLVYGVELKICVVCVGYVLLMVIVSLLVK